MLFTTYYLPCTPSFIEAAGSEINVVILQALLCGLLRTSFASISVIWETERWNIAQQTSIYFLVVSAMMLPVAYFSYWMEHSIKGFVSYLAMFILIFYSTREHDIISSLSTKYISK